MAKQNNAPTRERWRPPVAFLALLVLAAVLVAPQLASSATYFPSWNLLNIAFATPEAGFGVFQRESVSGNACQDYVGATSDGGVHFKSLALAAQWDCSTTEFSSTLVFDGVGDGFLYGPTLYVTHDDGRTWSRSAQPGRVLDVAAVGRSIWMVETGCAKAMLATTRCAMRLLQSNDGGRTWTLRSTPPLPVGMYSGTETAAGQTYLVRLSRTRAYVVGAPTPNAKGDDDAAPLLFTANDGATWSLRRLPCHLDAESVTVADAPNGVLYAVCDGQPSTGFQPKAALRSRDGGRTWSLQVGCKIEHPKTCSSPLNYGYLGAIVAPSPRSVFEVGDRTVLTASFDGGISWRAVRPLIGGAGGTVQAVFFNPEDGIVVVGFPSQLWVTSDGGTTWHQREIRSH
jgi:photosystem II stability/assembly factor-like uncharacterized protein